MRNRKNVRDTGGMLEEQEEFERNRCNVIGTGEM